MHGSNGPFLIIIFADSECLVMYLLVYIFPGICSLSTRESSAYYVDPRTRAQRLNCKVS